MRNYYFNNTASAMRGELIVVTERRFRNIIDNLLCGTKFGSWNNHWMYIEARNLAEAEKIAKRFISGN